MRDLMTAQVIVTVVMDRVMSTDLGDAMIDRSEFESALAYAIVDVADLLDPDEHFDAEV